MRCRYCFYRDVSSHRAEASFGVMQGETVAALVRKTLEYAQGGTVTYAFQGGEPLMAGEAFFRTFTETVNRCNTLHSPICYSLQTNGTLLTESLCQYFGENHYLIGVSLDGPRSLHDANRVFPDGGSFDRVMEGIALLRKHGVMFNILVVMTSRTAQAFPKLRLFFENCQLDDLQFIPCLEPFGAEPFSTEFAMSNGEYVKVNRMLFDWYLERNRFGRKLSVRHIDNLMRMLNGYLPEMCGAMGYCTGQLVVEGNGNCYPCDFYCDDAHLLGNIRTASLEEMSNCPVMRKFVEESYSVDEICRSCPVIGLCRGGCRRERDTGNTGMLHRNLYCEGRKKFFAYVLSKLNMR